MFWTIILYLLHLVAKKRNRDYWAVHVIFFNIFHSFYFVKCPEFVPPRSWVTKVGWASVGPVWYLLSIYPFTKHRHVFCSVFLFLLCYISIHIYIYMYNLYIFSLQHIIYDKYKQKQPNQINSAPTLVQPFLSFRPHPSPPPPRNGEGQWHRSDVGR